VTDAAAVFAIARLTAWRFVHGRLPWVGAIVAALPIAFAAALRGHASFAERSFEIEELLLVVLPAIAVAASITSELDDRAVTYLWSRPLARWTVMVGKLVVLAPFVVALVVASWIVSTAVGAGELASAASIGGLAAGALGATMTCAGLAIVAPRYGMVLAIVYMLCDGVVGEIPAHIQLISITHDAGELAGVTGSSPAIAAIGLVIVSTAWLAYGMRRIGRLEA
jgi:hypothetical protein